MLKAPIHLHPKEADSFTGFVKPERELTPKIIYRFTLLPFLIAYSIGACILCISYLSKTSSAYSSSGYGYKTTKRGYVSCAADTVRADRLRADSLATLTLREKTSTSTSPGKSKGKAYQSPDY